MAERFALRRIAEVDLDERPLDPEQGIAQRDLVWVKPSGIHDRAVEVVLVEPVDELALVIRLEEDDLEPQVERPAARCGVDLVDRLVP